MDEWFTIEKIDDETYAISEYGHWDHIGGHGSFDGIYVHKADEGWLKNGISIPLSFIKKKLMAEPFSKKAPEEFNIENYKTYAGEPTKILEDKDIIDIRLRKIRVIHTPGHSPGRICLFEEERGYKIYVK